MVVVRCRVNHISLGNGRHVVSIQGDGLVDRAIVAQNKAYFVKRVMASRSLDPEKVDAMIDDGKRFERMDCRTNPKTRRVEVKSTGAHADFTKTVNRRIADHKIQRYRGAPDR